MSPVVDGRQFLALGTLALNEERWHRAYSSTAQSVDLAARRADEALDLADIGPFESALVSIVVHPKFARLLSTIHAAKWRSCTSSRACMCGRPLHIEVSEGKRAAQNSLRRSYRCPGTNSPVWPDATSVTAPGANLKFGNASSGGCSKLRRPR